MLEGTLAPSGAAGQRQGGHADEARCPGQGAGATAHTVGVGRGVGPPWGLPKAPPARQGQLAPDHASPPPAEEVSRGAGHSTPGVPDQLHLPWCQRKDARALLKLLVILWD